MTFNVEQFKSHIQFGGQRPSLFAINFTVPTGIPEVSGSATELLSYNAKGSEIPASTLGIIEIGYFGRKIKVAGDRVFADWPVNLYCDEDFVTRTFFEAWSNGINEMEGNVRETSAIANQYKTDLTIIQYGKDGQSLRSYRMIGAWPAQVGNVTVDWDNQNQIIVFPVRFSYDYWMPVIEANARAGALSPFGVAADAAQASSSAGT